MVGLLFRTQVLAVTDELREGLAENRKKAGRGKKEGRA